MPTFLLILLSLLFSTLAILFSIEFAYCGVALFPKLASNSEKNIVIGNNKWKLIDSLTELLIICIFILLNNTNLILNNSVYWYLTIGFFAIITKSTIRMLLRKNTNPKGLLYKKIYLITSFVASISLGCLGIYFVTGTQFWQSTAGWSLFLALIVGIKIIGLSFVNRKPALIKNIKLKQTLQITFVVWILILGFFYPISLAHQNTELLGVNLSLLEAVIFAAVIGYTIASIKQNKPHELFHYTFLVGFLAPILIAWNNRPYLIYQNLTTISAFTLSSYSTSFNWLAWLTIVIIVLIIIMASHLLLTLLVPNLSHKKA